MPPLLTDAKATERRAKVLTEAHWCFLNFGFAKTTFEDIAKRADLSRTLLYRMFKGKEEIYEAVFIDWLLSRQDAAYQAAIGSGSDYDRLFNVCNLLRLETWVDMVDAPMGSCFFDDCERIDPERKAQYLTIMSDCINAILKDQASTDVFILALDGLVTDHPSVETLTQRVKILIARFTQA